MGKSSDIPVMVVGAGPVGLSLGIEMRRRGVDCKVIERNSELTPINESRALGIHARTLEVFEDMGVLDPVLNQGSRLKRFQFHQEGRTVAEFQLNFSDLSTSFPFALILSQGYTERFLLNRFQELGGEVSWNTEFKELKRADNKISLRLERNDEEIGLVSEWVIGCDGAHSEVRNQLGIPFSGDDYEDNFLLSDAKVRSGLSDSSSHFFVHEDGLIVLIPLPGKGYFRAIDATDPPEISSDERALERLERLLEQCGYPGFELIESRWTSSFRIYRRRAKFYRDGRCFLAGDSAHIHSPIGAQGMNTGIQDAYNLGWKLARTVRTNTGGSLLRSYGMERIPIARQVTTNTRWLTWLATLRNRVVMTVRNWIVKTVSGCDFVQEQLTRNLSQLGVHYESSEIVDEDWEGRSKIGVRSGHRLPNFEIKSPDLDLNTLHDLLRTTEHVFLNLRSNTESGCRRNGIRQLARKFGLKCKIYSIEGSSTDKEPVKENVIRDERLFSQLGGNPSALYLIRPDGYVGFRCRPAKLDKLEGYLDDPFMDDEGE